MIKKITPDNKIIQSKYFQKDKYKFFLILQNLTSPELELYSDEENYIVCRGSKKRPTWIWTKDNFDKSVLKELEGVINLYILDVETRFTCKKELYKLLKKDNFNSLGDYYIEMGFLVCNKTVKPKETDGYMASVTIEDKEILSNFIYDEAREIRDANAMTKTEAIETFEKRLYKEHYYVWKNKDNKIVCQAAYKVIDGNAKITGVYTPKEERNKGYAANLIYMLTNKVLNEGYHVSLYTDYNYAPSNRAYHNVGYTTEDVLINFTCVKSKNMEKKIEKN